MIQNQLGNKPKRWDKRGVVIQSNPGQRQYKVMVFGSRRITMGNRRFLRKYTPLHPPTNSPTGLPTNYVNDSLKTSKHPEVPNVMTDKEIDLQSNPDEQRGTSGHVQPAVPTTPVRRTQIHDYDIPPPPTTTSPLPSRTPTTTSPLPSRPTLPQPTIQAQVGSQASVPQPPETPTSPNQFGSQTSSVPQSTPFPGTDQVELLPEPQNSHQLRRSSRPNKGQTSKYQDYVEQITQNQGIYAVSEDSVYRLEDTQGYCNNKRNVGYLATPTQRLGEWNYYSLEECVRKIAIDYLNQLYSADTFPTYNSIQRHSADIFPTNNQFCYGESLPSYNQAQIFYNQAYC